jgi:hypothetical protein
MDTALSFVLRNKTDLEDSSLLGCYTLTRRRKKKPAPVHATEGK